MNFLFIKSFKISKKFIVFSSLFLILLISFTVFISLASNEDSKESKENNFIKWVDFNVTAEAMNLTAKLDIDSHNNNSDIKYNYF